VALEHIGGLDDVIVDAHQHQVFELHDGYSSTGGRLIATTEFGMTAVPIASIVSITVSCGISHGLTRPVASRLRRPPG
jgi:hypothetical protein